MIRTRSAIFGPTLLTPFWLAMGSACVQSISSRAPTSSMPLIAILIPLAVVLIGLLTTIRSASRVLLSMRASRWPQTVATLLEVEDRDVSGPEDTTHEIRVRYSYILDGCEHEGRTIHPCYHGGSRFGSAHHNLLMKLRSGHRLVVYYNPARPDQSTLTTGLHSHSWIPFLIGTVWTFSGAAFLLVFGMQRTIHLWSLYGYGFGGLVAVILLLLLLGRSDFASRITLLP